MQRHIVFIFIILLALASLGADIAPAPLPEPPDPPAPGGGADPGPEGDAGDSSSSDGGGVGSIIQRIFHIIRFPTETLAESLTIVLNEAAEKEAARLSGQTAEWAVIIGDVIQAPFVILIFAHGEILVINLRKREKYVKKTKSTIRQTTAQIQVYLKSLHGCKIFVQDVLEKH